MPLLPRDRIFLTDYVQMNWMHRYLAAQAFAFGGGPNSQQLAENEVGLCFPQKTPDQRKAIVAEANEKARVQGVMAPRIFAELVAALEDTGAFLRAVSLRRQGGILENNFDYPVKRVKTFFEGVRSSSGGLPNMLGLPPVSKVKFNDPMVATDIKAFYRTGPKRIRQAARAYLREGKRNVLKLNTGRVRRDYQHFAHILVGIRRAPTQAPPPGHVPAGLFVRTYNKVKHGFNVLESVSDYSRLPKGPESLEVVRASLAWGRVVADIADIGALCLLCNRLAQVILRLDETNSI